MIIVMNHEKMEDTEYLSRRNMLGRKGLKVVEIFPFTFFFLPLEALSFARCVTKRLVPEKNSDNAEDQLSETISNTATATSSVTSTSEDWFSSREDELAALMYLQTTIEMHILQTCTTDISEDEALLEQLQSDSSPSLPKVKDADSGRGDSKEQDSKRAGASVEKEDGVVFQFAASKSIQSKPDGSVEPMEEDDEKEKEAESNLPVDKDHLINAIRYRLTRKYILYRVLHLLDTLIDLISLSETRSVEENNQIIEQINIEYINDATEDAEGAIYVKSFRRNQQHIYLNWIRNSLLYPPS